MTEPTDYPWNIEIDIAGATFFGPGFEAEGMAEALALVLQDKDDVDNVEVIEQ